MDPITFCINTSNNEKSYIKLLLESMLNGINVNLHDILIFVDSDNEGTTEMLIECHNYFPNLTIIKNKGLPIGYQKNINWMFQYAKTNIVSYIQSDMVVGLNYDTSILSHLDTTSILSSTRCEPPLHARFDTPVNYVRNFGLIPNEFNYDEFLQFSESIKNPNKITNYFFAPFTLHKNLWNSINGHDFRFVKSREDSDILIRLCLNKCKIIQCWDALVYHFTCTSSRGIKWWEDKEQEIIRQKNDAIELDKFTKKWGFFAHPTSYEELIPYIIKNPFILNNIIVKNPPLEFEFEVL